MSPYDTAQSLSQSKGTFTTTDGLSAPGTTALFRVYVVLTTGNEKGSDTVSVERPA